MTPLPRCIIGLYHAGASTPALAVQFACSHSKVAFWLKRYGVKLRNRSTSHGPTGPVDKGKFRLMLNLRKSGRTLAQIAEAVDAHGRMFSRL